MRSRNNNITCNPHYIWCWQEKPERTHLYSSKYHGLILYYQWKNCLSFFLCPSHSTTRALNPAIVYFLNKFNPAVILFFFSLLLLALFTSSTSYAVRKAWVSHFKKACFKSSKFIIGSGLSTQPSWYFPQLLYINSVISAKWIFPKCHFHFGTSLI